jgi:hypothetical protein
VPDRSPPRSLARRRRPSLVRRSLGVLVLAALVALVVWGLLLGALWGYSLVRLGGEDVQAFRDDRVEALGEPRAPSGATTVLVTLTEEVDPTVPREPELLGPVALVQVGGPRDEPAVLVLPERIEVDVVEAGARMSLADIQLEGGSDLLVRSLVDFTEVRIDHVASLSVDALPLLLEAVGPVEVCGSEGCRAPTPEGLRAELRELEGEELIELVGELGHALGSELDATWAATSPLEARRVIDVVADEVATDASLRGTRLLDVTRALSVGTELDVDALPVRVDASSDEVLELSEPFAIRFQHLQAGTSLAGSAEEEDEVREDLLTDLEVAVVNGAGIDGLAGEAEVVLETAGFDVVGTGNAPDFDQATTAVRYRGGDDVRELGAFEVGEALGGEVSLEPSEAPPEFEGEPVDVLVVVGEDRAG